jgi:hypothetical protein
MGILALAKAAARRARELDAMTSGGAPPDWLREPRASARAAGAFIEKTLGLNEGRVYELTQRIADWIEREGVAGVRRHLESNAATDEAALVSQLPELADWLAHFRRAEAETPGVMMAASAANLIRLATASSGRLLDAIGRYLPPRLSPDAKPEERQRTETGWVAEVAEHAFALLAVEPVAWVESIRTGKALYRNKNWGNQLNQTNDELRAAHAPLLFADAAVLRNGAEHSGCLLPDDELGTQTFVTKSGEVSVLNASLLDRGRAMWRQALVVQLALFQVGIESQKELFLQRDVLDAFVASLRQRPDEAARWDALKPRLERALAKLKEALDRIPD